MNSNNFYFESFNDSEIDKALDKVESLKENKPDEAFDLLLLTINVINSYGQQLGANQPKIINKLQTWISRIKKLLKKLARKIGADSFSISANSLFTITITVTWKVQSITGKF